LFGSACLSKVTDVLALLEIDRQSTLGGITMNSGSNGNQAALALVGRVLLGAVFIMSGLGKLGAPGSVQGYIASVGLPAPLLAYIIALIVEVGGGVLLLVGYRTKAVAAALAVFCVLTAVLFHRALGDQNQLIHFLKDLAMAGGLLEIAAFGPGRIGLDSRSAARA
jgi:putative oxidoreductase